MKLNFNAIYALDKKSGKKGTFRLLKDVISSGN